MRLFWGVLFSEKERRLFSKTGEKLISEFDQWGQTSLANLHTTLLFLGDVDPSQLDKLYKIGENLANEKKSFLISAGNLNYFPSRKGRTVVQSLLDKTGELETLHTDLFKQCSQLLTLKAEKRFRPHVTLFRRVYAKDPAFWREIKGVDCQHRPIQIVSFDLLESKFEEKGVTYSVLRSFPLVDNS